MTIASSFTKIKSVAGTTKPKHHSYPVHMIAMAINLLSTTGIGGGTCIKILRLVAGLFPGLNRVPSRSSVLNWFRKMAAFQAGITATDYAGKWVVMFDESISIGADKVLLIIGIRLQDYHFNRPLTFEDCHVLATPISPSWTAFDVAEQINKLVQQGLHIEYAVSDNAPNLIKASRDCGLNLISDCSHYFANLLKREFSQDSEFQHFEKKCTEMKRKGTRSAYAHLLPPKHHAHSRFMNIGPVIDWAIRALFWMKHHSNHELIRPFLKHLLWLKEYESLINRMHHSIGLCQQLMSALKDEGFHSGVYQWSYYLLNHSIEVPIALRRKIWSYFGQLNEKCDKEQRLICSTDILESHFSFLKRKPAHAVAAAAKAMVIYNRKFDYSQVLQAMEKTTTAALRLVNTSASRHLSVAQKRRVLNRLIA